MNTTPIRYEFLKRAEQVCELAQVDHWEYSEVVSGLREQMEESGRTYERGGFYKDEAEARALEDFGSVKSVAKAHRGGFRGWCHRLVFSQRYSIHRLVFPVVLCLYHGMLSSESAYYVAVYGGGLSFGTYTLFGPQYYLSIIYIFAAVICRELNRRLRTPALLVQCIAMVATLWAFKYFIGQWIENILDTISLLGVPGREVNATVRKALFFGLFVLNLIDAASMMASILLAAAQIFDLAGRWREMIETRRRIFG